jgi:hypothetical protein
MVSSVMLKLMHMEETLGGKTSTWSIASACIPVHSNILLNVQNLIIF